MYVKVDKELIAQETEVDFFPWLSYTPRKRVVLGNISKLHVPVLIYKYTLFQTHSVTLECYVIIIRVLMYL